MYAYEPPPLKGLKLDNVVNFDIRQERKRRIKKQREKEKNNIVAFKKSLPDNIEDFGRLVKIRSGGEHKPFELYDYQKLLLKLINDNKVTELVKTRQIGFSEVLLLYIFFQMTQNGAFTAIVISKTQKKASELASRLRDMIEMFPSEYGLHLTDKNLFTQRLTNGATVHFASGTTPESVIGIPSVSFVFLDEAAFYPFLDIYSKVEPTLSAVGDKARIVIGSTPNLMTDDFATTLFENNEIDFLQLINEVRREEQEPIQWIVDNKGWCKLIVHWKAHPIYGKDPEFLENKIRSSPDTENKVRMEYDLSFEAGGEGVFSPALVRQVCSGEMTKTKRDNCHYYMGLDPNFGGADYLVFTVIEHDLLTGKFAMVDWYRKSKSSHTYHLLYIYELIDKYNPEKVAVEVNSGGKFYFDEMNKTYPNLIFEPIRTNENNKINMVSRLLYLMEKEQMTLPNMATIKNELLSFEKKGKKMEAIEGKHDDIPMSLSIVSSILPEDNIINDYYDDVRVA